MIQDTLTLVVDSLPAAVDTLTAAVDTLTAAVSPASQLGSQVNAGVALGLGALVKLAVDLTRKGVAALDTAPGFVKALVATVFAGVATWASGALGMPVSPDLTVIDTTVASLVVAALSMGVNALVKTAKPKSN